MSGTEQAATFWFAHLTRLMREAPITVEEMKNRTNLSSATVGRARRGECMKRETVVAIFDVLAAIPRYASVLPANKDSFLLPCGTETTVDIDAFFKAVK